MHVLMSNKFLRFKLKKYHVIKSENTVHRNRMHFSNILWKVSSQITLV